MSNINLNREAYLEKAKNIVLPILESKGFKLPEGKQNMALSVGFSRSRKAVGSWNANYDKEGKFIDHQIFINPTIDDSIEVIDTLIHELCHAIQMANNPTAKGHGKEFIEVCKAIGLESKPVRKGKKITQSWTVASANDSLRMEIKKWVDSELGQYPHNHLNIHSMPKQGTRLLKAYCPQSKGGKGDYKVRITQGIADIQVPICGCCEGLYQDAMRDAIKEAIANDESIDDIDLDDIAEPFRLILE